MDLLYGVLAMFPFHFFCIESRVLSECICREGMVNCILDVYHFWLVH